MHDDSPMLSLKKDLIESEAQLRALSENIANGMVYQVNTGIDGKSRIFTYISPAVERLHGLSVEEARRNPLLIYQQIVEEHRQMVAEKEALAIESMKTFAVDVMVEHPSGHIFWRRFVSTPRITSDGTLLWDGIELDISDEKLKEEEREKLKDQLIQAQKIESVGQLAGGIAHDFNNMLSVIIGHAELAMMQLNQANPIYTDLQEILGAARRSADLTRQLLAFARKQPISPRVVDLNDTVSGMIKMLKRMIGEDIELSWLPEAGLWPVKIDPTQIDQILANLCINARDAVINRGIITIETGKRYCDANICLNSGVEPGDYVYLSVSDNGCGMGKDIMSHLFEPFFTTKDVGKGTGMGLSMIYGIVKQNNGFIKVYSEPGRGSSFMIYLPRFEDNSIPQNLINDKESLMQEGRECLLLVEDEPGILKMGKAMLESMGYKVITASTPGDAILIADEFKDNIHLLITDVIMPGMTGKELSKRLLASRPALKILFMSGYTANVISRHGVLEEDVNFIHKPFSLNELSAKVRSALSHEINLHNPG